MNEPTTHHPGPRQAVSDTPGDTARAPAAAEGVTAQGGEDAALLVERLRRTFRTGRTRDANWRIAQLNALVRMLKEREDALLTALGEDLGRHRVESLFLDVTSTIGAAEHSAAHVRGWMEPVAEKVPFALRPASAAHRPEPLGVTMVIGAWNYPVNLTLGPLVAALAAGNCVVVKPSEVAPATSAVMAAGIRDHLDPDAVAVVEGGADVTQDLIGTGLDLIFFTGSATTGRKVLAAAAPHLTPVVLELGGKSPAVVAADADMATTAKRIAWGKLTNAGQTCVAPDYVLVERAGAEELVDELARALEEQYPDIGEMAHIVSEAHAERLARLLGDHGGRVVTGGDVDPGERRVTPTLVVDPDPGSRLMTEEIFGPVLPVVTVENLDEAVAFVGARPHPLALYVFGSDRSAVDRVIQGTQSGGVCVNHVVLQLGVEALPFGGVGGSGMGNYHGRFGFEAFSHRRAILRKGFLWPDSSELLHPPFRSWKEKLLRLQLR